MASISADGLVADGSAPVHLFADNRKLSESHLAVAREICSDAVKMVRDRDFAVNQGSLDA
jgi:hypothetical protein